MQSAYHLFKDAYHLIKQVVSFSDIFKHSYKLINLYTVKYCTNLELLLSLLNIYRHITLWIMQLAYHFLNHAVCISFYEVCSLHITFWIMQSAYHFLIVAYHLFKDAYHLIKHVVSFSDIFKHCYKLINLNTVKYCTNLELLLSLLNIYRHITLWIMQFAYHFLNHAVCISFYEVCSLYITFWIMQSAYHFLIVAYHFLIVTYHFLIVAYHFLVAAYHFLLTCSSFTTQITLVFFSKLHIIFNTHPIFKYIGLDSEFNL